MNNSLPRLGEGDEKYQVWVVALEAYVRGIRDAFEKDPTLGGNWIKDKIDTIPVRAPGFVSDDVPAGASGV